MNFTELLDLLGYAPGERLSLNCQAAGGGQFTSRVLDYDGPIESRALALSDGNNVWFGVNPISPRESGRGGADDVTRLAAVWCDLDVKPGACRDLDHAWQIIAALSELVGTRPSAVVMSGHGLQPYWP